MRTCDRHSPDDQQRGEPMSCCTRNLTGEEKQALQKMVKSLVGQSEEEYMKKFEALVRSAARAANAGNHKEAEQAALEMLMMAGAKALESPSPDVQLAEEAARCEGAGDWVGAEAARRKLLRVQKRTGNLGLIAKAQRDLSGLLRLLGRRDEAWRYARAACQSARRADLAPLTVMTLVNKATCALERNRASQALADAEEALRLVKRGRIYNRIRMTVLTLRADCRLAQADEKRACRDLRAAGRLESKLAFPGLCGAPAARTRCLEVWARLHQHRGDLREAARHLTRAIEIRRAASRRCCLVSPYATEALARSLEALADVSKHLGDETAARKSLRQAKTLRQQARLPLTSALVSARGRRSDRKPSRRKEAEGRQRRAS